MATSSVKNLRRSVTVRVPATTANMGPGFDAVGMALNIYNDLTVSSVDPVTNQPWSSFHMEVEGEGITTLPRNSTNIVCQALALAFQEAGYSTVPPLHYHLVNRIPIGAGLGSSSAAIVAGLLAGLAITNHPVSVTNEETALQLAAKIEGHVDNLAPCIYGNMQIGIHTGQRWYTTSVNIPSGLQCIMFIPEQRQDTEGARAILPTIIPRTDAVYNIGRVALLINAFASGNLDDLLYATQDKLHQPAREKIMPWLRPVVDAAIEAGAKGAFLSGAGSSIMAITSGRKGDIHGQNPQERKDIEVARAMALAARKVGFTGRIFITQPTQLGGHITAFDGDSNAVMSGKGLGVDLLALDNSLTKDEDISKAMQMQVLHATGNMLSPTKLSSTGGIVTGSSGDSSSSNSSTNTIGTEHTSVPTPTTALSSSSSTSLTYISTRGEGMDQPLSFTDVVFAGLAHDGGLYIPNPNQPFPTIETSTLQDWMKQKLTYAQVATKVFALFIKDDQIPYADLERLCHESYHPSRWSSADIAPVITVPFKDPTKEKNEKNSKRLYIAEHFHGPTCAFKDLALQFLGNLFEYLLTKKQDSSSTPQNISTHGTITPSKARLTILGATSGDTGSAAIAGLRGKENISVFILHPLNRVAKVQELQMTTCLDTNVHNIAVEQSDFDACQTMVKQAFTDETFRQRHSLSAINSINWARILAQTVYYVWTYMQWYTQQHSSTISSVVPLPSVTYVIPTGNFGNALSAYYAKQLGIPVKTICVATNANDILHRFLSNKDNGKYICASTVSFTYAPSMDIQAASNIERFIYHALYAAETDKFRCKGLPYTPKSIHTTVARYVQEWTGSVSRTKQAVLLPPTPSPSTSEGTTTTEDTNGNQRYIETIMREYIQTQFISSTANNDEINTMIETYLQSSSDTATDKPYAVCPHTACGLHAVSILPSLIQDIRTSESVIVMATAHPAKFASSTPALAQKGLYYPDVEGSLSRPIVPPLLPATTAVISVVNETLPLLPKQLQGLYKKPRQYTVMMNNVENVKTYVDTVSDTQ